MRTMRAAVVVAALLGGLATSARAQGPCTPVLLCPQPSGGSGAVGGAGTGGRAGTGGAGGRPAAGTGGSGGQPASGLVITAALELDRRVVRPGEVLNASVTYGNTSGKAITVREIRIAARGPGATHGGGPYTDLAPVLTAVTIEPGQTIALGASRTFTSADPVGEWEAYATHQDAAGAWHDAPSELFAVVAALGPKPPGGRMPVGVQEWFIAPWAGTTIYKPNVDWANAYARGDDIWSPTFLAELQGFVTFRHMDTNATNFSRIAHWSERRLPTDPGNAEVYIDGASPASTTGMAVEWQIDLCVRANLDCWFTLPMLADDDYVRQQALLVKAKLAPSLRAYVELSNEIWNGQFRQCQQAIDAGNAGGLPGSNDWYRGIAYEMKRAVEVYAIWQEVFGASAMGSRVIRVFAESGNLDLTTQALRNVYASAHWNPAGQKIDMLALAPYIGSSTAGASEKLSRWKSEVDAKVAGEPIEYALAQHVRPYSIPMLGCYEAGSHHTTSADVWARNPEAYDAYQYMLERFATKMNAVCNLYTGHGTWKTDGTGAWGLRDHVGQALADAPKARGTKDWIAAGVTTRGVDVRTVALVAFLIVIALLVYLVGLRLYVTRRRPPPPSSPPEPRDD